MPAYDLLVYHDFTDNLNASLNVGDDAEAKLGDTFTGMYVVAVAPPVHEGRAATVVLAHGNRPMEELQQRLGGSGPRSAGRVGQIKGVE
jgi:hypothetical protein